MSIIYSDILWTSDNNDGVNAKNLKEKSINTIWISFRSIIMILFNIARISHHYSCLNYITADSIINQALTLAYREFYSQICSKFYFF